MPGKTVRKYKKWNREVERLLRRAERCRDESCIHGKLGRALRHLTRFSPLTIRIRSMQPPNLLNQPLADNVSLTGKLAGEFYDS